LSVITEPATRAPQRKLLVAAAIGELIADKLPWVPSRTEPLPFLGRVTGGIVCGGVAAGPIGALAGAATATATTIAGYQAAHIR
jgi:uncharacterized membrane protein